MKNFKKLKKLELNKKSIVKLESKDAQVLKGGHYQQLKRQDAGGGTIAWDTHVNTCFTHNCC